MPDEYLFWFCKLQNFSNSSLEYLFIIFNLFQSMVMTLFRCPAGMSQSKRGGILFSLILSNIRDKSTICEKDGRLFATQYFTNSSYETF